jgi:hypothetical protein
MNENGHSIMSFTRMPPSLVSVDWYLQQHRAADGPGLLTPEGTYDLILFMPDGMITGIIHGIQLFAQYDADDSSISFGPVAMLIAEDDDPGKASESREMIESMFGEARTYWVWNGTLELSSGDGKPLVTMANTPAL